MEEELGSNGSPGHGTSAGDSQKGCFVMWQMDPNKWLVELVLGGQKVVAGSDGNVAWRHTPWLGAHAAKGGVRPLRRAIQASTQHPLIQRLCQKLNRIFLRFLLIKPKCTRKAKSGDQLGNIFDPFVYLTDRPSVYSQYFTCIGGA